MVLASAVFFLGCSSWWATLVYLLLRGERSRCASCFGYGRLCNYAAQVPAVLRRVLQGASASVHRQSGGYFSCFTETGLTVQIVQNPRFHFFAKVLTCPCCVCRDSAENCGLPAAAGIDKVVDVLVMQFVLEGFQFLDKVVDMRVGVQLPGFAESCSKLRSFRRCSSSTSLVHVPVVKCCLDLRRGQLIIAMMSFRCC